jgi:LmbE family N-acetylglucosaminyl deacetylase
MKTILVVAAHPDDEILGIGGTVRKHYEKGDSVYCLILGEGMTSRGELSKNKVEELHKSTLKAAEVLGYKEVYFENMPDNKFDSVPLLEIIKKVEKYIDKISPNTIYTHHEKDLNIDHTLTYKAVLTATRPFGDYQVKEIYTFETPSSTEWNFTESFEPNTFVDISKTIEFKIKAMSFYETELRPYPYPRSLEALKIISKRWGTVVGKKNVEALRLIRKVE